MQIRNTMTRRPIGRMLLAACLLFATPLSAQQPLPFLPSHTDESGKMGYKDEQGNILIPCIFDFARSFKQNEFVAFVRYDGRYYLIDRAGNRVTEADYHMSPDIYRRFCLIDDYGIENDYLIDLRGRRISPEGAGIVALRVDDDERDPALFAMREPGRNLFALTDLSFRPLTPIRAREFRPFGLRAGLIEFQTDSGHGILNAAGEVIIPAQYSRISYMRIENAANLTEKLRKAGLYDRALGEMIVFVAYKGDYITFYDEAGQIVIPPQKGKQPQKILSAAFKTDLLPYAQRFEETRRQIERRVDAPLAACRTRHEELTAALPRTPATHGSIVAALRRTESQPDTERYTPAECFRRGFAHYRERCYDQAVPWLLRAAEAKVREAYFPLGECYAMTGCTYEDPAKAHYWLGISVGYTQPASRDYWFACYLLGTQFEHGNGCDRNYDSALHFYRQFRNNTTAENRSLADQCIARVQTGQRGSAGGSTTGTAQAGRQPAVSRSARAADTPPTSGTCYWGKGETAVHCRIEFDVQQGDRLIHPYPYNSNVRFTGSGGVWTSDMMLYETTADAFVYKEIQLHYNASFFNPQTAGQLSVRREFIENGETISIARDLSWVRYSQGLEADERIDEAGYERRKAAWDSFVQGAGGGGGGESGPVEVKSGMSASYYQDTYARWARVAESAYRSLTAAGISVRDRAGNRAGTAAGSWQGSSYAGMKSELTRAQSAMRSVRAEAARAGHTIAPSPWETATVSY